MMSMNLLQEMRPNSTEASEAEKRPQEVLAVEEGSKKAQHTAQTTMAEVRKGHEGVVTGDADDGFFC